MPHLRTVLAAFASVLASASLNDTDAATGEGGTVALGTEVRPPCGSVTPCNGSATALTNAVNQTVQFTITTSYAGGESYNLACSFAAPVTSCSSPSSRDVLDPQHSETVLVTFSTGGTAGTGSVSLTATPTFYPGDGQSTGRYNVTVGTTATVVVTPDAGAGPSLPSRTNTKSFTVQNAGTTTNTYNLQVTSCSGSAISGACTLSPSSVTLAASTSSQATVSYNTVATIGATGRITLLATYNLNAAVKDSGWIDVAIGDPVPTVSVSSLNPGAIVERDLCLTVPAGGDAAYECGDLRIAHALPATRTLGKTRVPTLLYNSQHGHPFPTVAANVTLLPNTPSPDSVTAALTINGTNRTPGAKWNGTDWVPGSTRRITVGFDGLSDGTGIYAYTLEVSNWHQGVRTPRSVTGQLVIVNRRNSPYGAGWWLAGLEELRSPGAASMVWIGGDGSVREYAQVGGVWAAPKVDRPDTIKYDGTHYVRYLPHGLKVKFDGIGRHVATVNRLGHTTTFAYSVSALLQTVTPPPVGAPYWSFSYSGDTLKNVSLVQGSGLPSPTISLTVDKRRVTIITDPDNRAVSFSYSIAFPPIHRILARTDRRGTMTSFSYDSARKLSQVSIAMGAGQSPIVTAFHAQERRGFAGASAATDTSLAYTKLDGPRTDVGDTTLFWLDRFGAARRIRNATGDSTLLSRTDARWPGLVTRVRYHNGRIVAAVYDTRGNVQSSTDSSKYSGANYATTSYLYDGVWDFVTRITPPLGSIITFGYDPVNGNRLWQQPGGNTARKVYFRYGNGFKLLSSVKTPLASRPIADPVRDSLTYDALGNLYETVLPSTSDSPYRLATTFRKDRLGRDTLITHQVGRYLDSNQLIGSEKISYDAVDRVILRKKGGPETNAGYDVKTGVTRYWWSDTLTVSLAYDAEGNLTSSTSQAFYDYNGLGAMMTRWEYDRANRQIKEIAPDSRVDSTTYDLAGNVVETQTRRGHRITMSYDRLNRLSQRIVPAADYGTDWGVYPRYPNNGTGFRAAGDTALFSYDAMGNVLTADNSDARVARTYNLDGTLSSEEQRIRVYAKTWQAAADFSKHVYLLRYSYDLNGRRTALKHPARLLMSGWPDSTRYTYDSIAGGLSSIVNPAGFLFRLRYDNELRLDSLINPNGTSEKRIYDANNRLGRVTQNAPVNANGGYSDGIIHDNRLLFDDAGLITQATDRKELYRNWYTGLGAIGWQDENYCQATCSAINQYVRTRTQWYTTDALGNNRSDISAVNLFTPIDSTIHHYDVAGRITMDSLRSGGGWVTGPYVSDSSGNTRLTGRSRLRDVCVGEDLGQCSTYNKYAYSDSKAMYYGADNKLRAVDRITTDPSLFIPYDALGGFEEYRYDALGRRVLKRWRGDCPSTCNSTTGSGFPGHVERYVHDGNQILHEIRMPGGKKATADSMETDNADSVFGSSGHTRYGRVIYTHGLGIDQAVQAIRTTRANIYHPRLVIFLHADWRGEYTKGTNETGLREWCMPGRVNCAKVSFGSRRIKTYFDRATDLAPDQPPNFWVGSFLSTKMDMSGQVYMRNRYFDPATGRFTQEDPIGLAGGLNVYGFANGDPVNFSDPFGLCPDPNDTWCAAFESGMTILGGAAGLLIGGVVGGAEIVGTGGIATPAAIATVAATTVGGLMIGKAAGQAISNVLFADKARPKDGSEQRDDIEKEQAGRQKQGRGESLRSIEKSKQRGKVSDKQKAQDALDETHKNVEP